MSEIICPSCKNPIYDEEALLCHFCGESLHRTSKGAMGKVRLRGNNLVWMILIFLTLLSFILLFVRK